MESRYLIVNEAVNYLRISRAKFFQLLKEPGFPQIRLGKRILIPKDKLDEWMDEQAKKHIIK